jgi:hypothetical protein
VYSSLERVDIVLEDEAGGTIHAQTDHRSTEEMASTPELSSLFAIARVLTARRNAPSKLRVAYFARCEPPAFLRDVLALLGAELFVGQEAHPLKPRRGSVEALVDERLRALADGERAARGLTYDSACLETLARDAARTPPVEEDEAEHWARVLGLAAFSARVLESGARGRWSTSDKTGSVPFVFELELPSGPLTLDLMAGAKRAVAGSATALLELVSTAREHLRELH